MKLRKLVGWLGIVSLASLGVMCGPSAGSYCDARCDCLGCSTHDYDHCRIDYESTEEHADLHGCSDLWDEYADCTLDERACFNGDADYGCDPELERYNNCVR
jgi:hypothetical protein